MGILLYAGPAVSLKEEVRTRVPYPQSFQRRPVIHYGPGGGPTKWENCGSESFCAPPPTKTAFVGLLLMGGGGGLFVLLFIMAKLSSVRVKTTSRHCVPPYNIAKDFHGMSPICRVKTLLAHPPFCSPPPVNIMTSPGRFQQ